MKKNFSISKFVDRGNGKMGILHITGEGVEYKFGNQSCKFIQIELLSGKIKFMYF